MDACWLSVDSDELEFGEAALRETEDVRLGLRTKGIEMFVLQKKLPRCQTQFESLGDKLLGDDESVAGTHAVFPYARLRQALSYLPDRDYIRDPLVEAFPPCRAEHREPQT